MIYTIFRPARNLGIAIRGDAKRTAKKRLSLQKVFEHGALDDAASKAEMQILLSWLGADGIPVIQQEQADSGPYMRPKKPKSAAPQ